MAIWGSMLGNMFGGGDNGQQPQPQNMSNQNQKQDYNQWYNDPGVAVDNYIKTFIGMDDDRPQQQPPTLANMYSMYNSPRPNPASRTGGLAGLGSWNKGY